MKIGETIKALRKKKNIAQKDFAVQCGISKTYLSLIENDRKRPTLDLLEKIGAELKIPFPIISFLSLEEEEIQEEKRAAYKIMAPAINAMITELFTQ